MSTAEKPAPNITLRCPFCGTLNRVEMSKAADRPKCGKCEKPMLLDRPVKLAQDDFDRTVLESGTPVLVDFYADWCGPCKLVAPLVDEIARSETGRLVVAKVDTDHAAELSRRMSIRGIPTLILFKEGEEVGRSVGFEPDKVRQLVKTALTPA